MRGRLLGTIALAVVASAAAASCALAQQAAVSVASLLKDGYEIKTAFADGTGGAYIVMQRGISAYMCHSTPRQTCEKLN